MAAAAALAIEASCTAALPAAAVLAAAAWDAMPLHAVPSSEPLHAVPLSTELVCRAPQASAAAQEGSFAGRLPCTVAV